MATQHKTVRRAHEPGDCHEITFSCYRRMPLLTNDDWRLMLAESVDRRVALVAISECHWSYSTISLVGSAVRTSMNYSPAPSIGRR